MERIKGFINLNEILGIPEKKEISYQWLYKTLKSNDNVSINKFFGESQLVCNFIHEKVKYYWKYEKEASPYNELLVCEIARDLGIPCINYDLALIGGFPGTISQNYKVDNADYISGGKILYKYHEDDLVQRRHNTLENIERVLMDYYINHPRKEKIINRIMHRLVMVFVLDVITGQTDRNYDNWEIIEYWDVDNIDVQPLFDNIRILTHEPAKTRIVLGVDGKDLGLLDEVIPKFQKYKGGIFANLIPDSLWVISEENLQKVFARIDAKTGYPMPDELKKDYLEKFKIHKEFIMQILGITESRKGGCR